MLKWTAHAFALAATLQLGLASAQDAESGAELVPPDSAEVEAGAEIETPAPADRDQPAEELQQDVPANQPAGPAIEGDDVQQNEGVIQRESRYPPGTAPQAGFEISDRVRAATANLDIDDATRSRYRWHNGEWWFQTNAGTWKYHRNGEWHSFDPTTYRATRSGVVDPGFSGSGYAPQAGVGSGYAVPRTYSSDSYYYGTRPNVTTRRHGVYRPDYERFDGRYYQGGYGGRVYGDDYYYGRGYGPGYGYGQGYNRATDRYYGYGPGGRYSIDGDRYRGGVIGSEIGGRIGGRSGAIIGGAIGAEAAA